MLDIAKTTSFHKCFLIFFFIKVILAKESSELMKIFNKKLKNGLLY